MSYIFNDFFFIPDYIFIACNKMLQHVEWEIVKENNEWSYVGLGEEFKTRKVQKFINQFFREHEIYFVVDRHHSIEILKQKSAIKNKEEIDHRNIVLCDMKFHRFMVFNHVGVTKHGKYKGS